MSAFHPQLFLLRLSGEVTTKARGTRLQFQRRLRSNIVQALAATGLESKVHGEWSRIFVEAPAAAALDVLPRVFGLQSLSAVERRPWSHLDDIVEAGEALFAEAVVGRTFGVRARRSGEKRFIPFRSAELERALGSRLYPRAAGVDLTAPELWVQVEVREGEAYFYREKVAAPGGLPLGSEGRALALVSGGFDSAVAAWSLLKRGVRLDYLFCNLGGDAHRRGVLEVMKLVADRWSYGYQPRLFEVDLRPAVDALQRLTEPRYWQVLLKRLMVGAGDRLARRRRWEALVTGEAVGQVSSQTLRNLRVISQACERPILRPLAAMNKEEIVDLARRIGTYELSAGTPEYCALQAKRPSTHARPQAIAAEEAKLPDDLLEAAVAGHTVVNLATLEISELVDAALAVDRIPPDASVLDLRSEAAFAGWHYPGARRVDYFTAQRALAELPAGPTYVLYCEVGLKSAHLAELLRGAGRRAYHFEGGLREVLRYVECQDPALAALASPAWLGDP